MYARKHFSPIYMPADLKIYIYTFLPLNNPEIEAGHEAAHAPILQPNIANVGAPHVVALRAW